MTPTPDQVMTGATELLGLALLAGGLAAVVALGYRWATREEVPLGLALLVGLAGVAAYLNTTSVLGQVIEGNLGTVQTALFNVGAFLSGGGGAVAGRRWGNAFGRDVLQGGERQAVDEEVSRLVKTVGRVTTVTMPQEIDDVVGYDPVSERTRDEIADRQFVFPRNLTVAELDRRIRSRLKTDFGVGTVDLDLAADGTVNHLAVGSRPAGIGPTLPSATNAVALRADPAFDASTGDVVQVWETDSMRRVLTGELRGVADDVVTVAINSSDTPKVDPTRTYRLVTLPVEDRPAREFASLLRAADESYTSVTVEAGSPLHGMPVGALDLTVVAVSPEDARPTTLPPREYVLEPGETLSAIALPAVLRKLEAAAMPLDPSLIPDSEPATPSAVNREPDGPAPSPEPTSDSPPAGVEADTDVGDTVAEVDEPSPDQTATADTDSGVTAGADSPSFEDLKSEYEEGDGWDEQDDDDHEPIEQIVESDDSATESTDSGESSFEDLKAEFDSGEADWDEPDDETRTADQDEPDEASEADSEPGGSEDVVSLDEAEISFEEDDSEELDEFGDSDDSAEDDITSLTVEEDDDDGLFDDDSLDDDSLFEEDDGGLFEDEEDGGLFEDEDEAATEDENDEEGEDETEEDDEDDEDDSGGGGGSTFAQLKEEFESGEADWEDDVSDSPGGDMRLDE
ncbi:potassium transporter TrkA [Halovenus salina]|uniref:Potassium transporter TrkA n=1 Tax=Halovenus salina TaxID=1510225 RepID=A0ABD5W2C0_9EURY|nr:potassium transporter TrkA [Halovenus salina]